MADPIDQLTREARGEARVVGQMKVLSYIKKYGTTLPIPMGAQIARVPYSIRPVVAGPYRKSKQQIALVKRWTNAEKKQYVLRSVKNIADHAYQTTKFYKEFYDGHGFDPTSIATFNDISSIPVVRKSDFLKYTIEERSSTAKGRFVVNTGGSSGATLDLYVTPDSVGREWAHMHEIWKPLGFSQESIQVVFSGQSKDGQAVSYDSARHQFNVNAYIGWAEVAEDLAEVYSRYGPQFIRGYPGLIFDFVFWVAENNPALLNVLKQSTTGLMLSSEYPNPAAREKVERLLSCASVSWYGHTERAVLAREVGSKGLYEPFLSYGFCQTHNGLSVGNLTATSYFNFATPLVRFDTEDEIEATTEDDLMTEFRVVGGRNSESIVDKTGQSVSLTALIYGRHHDLFNHVTNIQVRQVNDGSIDVLYVRRESADAALDAKSLFSGSGINIDMNFVEIKSPIVNANGKTPLLVR